MAYGYDKQSASRPITSQVVQNAQGAFSASAAFGGATQQIRLMSQIQGWATIGTTSDAILASSAGGIGMIITGLSTFSTAGSFVGQVYPEYFAVTPGQKFCFASTSTSSGALTITEMG